MNCKLYFFKVLKYSGVNSTIQQHESKVLENNYKMQESIMNTMNKYNDEV